MDEATELANWTEAVVNYAVQNRKVNSYSGDSTNEIERKRRSVVAVTQIINIMVLFQCYDNTKCYRNNFNMLNMIKRRLYGAIYDQLSLVVRKPVFGVSDQVRHKPGCTATEDGMRLEISDLGSRGIVLSVLRKQRR